MAASGTVGLRAASELFTLAAETQQASLKEQEAASKEADELAIMEAENKLSQAELEIRMKVQERRGKNALGLINDIEPEWNKRMGEIESTLVHDRQRRLFRIRAERRRLALQGEVFSYMAKELEDFDREQTDQFINSERNVAASAFLNPERVKLSIDGIREALSKYAERTGKPKEFVEAAAQKAIGDTVRAVTYMALLRGRLDLAESYLSSYSDTIDSDSAKEITSAISHRRLMTQAVEVTDAIFTPERQSLEDALSEARKIDNPELREKVEQMVRRRWADITQARAEEQEAAFEKAAKIVENTLGDVELIPEHIWTKLTASQRAALERVSVDLRKPKLNPDLRDSALTEFWTMTLEERARIKPVDLIVKWRPYVPEQDYQEMVKAVGAAKEAAVGRNREQYEAIVGPKEAVLHELQRLGLYPFDEKEATKEDRRRAVELFRQIDIHRARAKAENKPIPDLRTLTRQLIYQTVQEPGNLLRGPRPKRLIELEPGEAVIPPEPWKKAIEQEIKNRGKIATEDLIQKLYGAYLLGDDTLFEQFLAEAK